MSHDNAGAALDGASPTLSAAMSVISAITARAADAGHLVTVAVTDRAGDLVAFGRMDGGERRWLRQAKRKAYTSAIMGRTTTAFGEQLRSRDLSIVEYGDLRLTSLPGGAPLLSAPGRAIAAVGVAGNGGAERENELAAFGVQLLGEQVQ